jgi:hypothetical protein
MSYSRYLNQKSSDSEWLSLFYAKADFDCVGEISGSGICFLGRRAMNAAVCHEIPNRRRSQVILYIHEVSATIK